MENNNNMLKFDIYIKNLSINFYKTITLIKFFF